MAVSIDELESNGSRQQLEHFSFIKNEPFSVGLRVDGGGFIHAGGSNLHGSDRDVLPKVVHSTIKECNLNVYAAAKTSKDDIFINRARSCSISTNGDAFRVGSRIFFNSGSKNGDIIMEEHFDVTDLSLYLDHIEQREKYLFVTSRQKILELPSDQQVSKTKPITSKPTKMVPFGKNDEGSDTSKSDESESDVQTEVMSAYESWSEASTEFSESDILRVPRPRSAAASDINSEEAEGNESEDSPSSLSEASDGSEGSDSDTNSIQVSNTRYTHVMDDEEEEHQFDHIWDDRDEPDIDGDEYIGAWSDNDGSDDSNSDGLYGGNFNESDGISDLESDSEQDEPNNKGDTDRKAAAEPANDQCNASQVLGEKLKPSKASVEEANKAEGSDSPAKNATGSNKDNTASDTAKEVEGEAPCVMGSAVSQLHVYDITSSPIARVFRFTRPTMQLIRDSPPVVHPTKPLVVWPLGDNNILFADYRDNTYYVRKFRMSRFWSQHIKIECRFSTDGGYLYIASLKMRRKLPVRRKRNKTGKKAKDQKAKSDTVEVAVKSEDETLDTDCDVLVLTYKLSGRKTTRSPPVLVNRTYLPLGKVCLTEALPTFTWTEHDIFITHAIKADLRIFRIALYKGERIVHDIQTPATPVEIADLEHRAEVYFVPSDTVGQKAKVVIARAQLAMKMIDSMLGDKTRDTNAKDEIKPPAECAGAAISNSSNTQAGNGRQDNGLGKDSDLPEQIDKLEMDCDPTERRTQLVEIELELEPIWWTEFEAIEHGKTVGTGRMEIETVNFDQTDDCDCDDN